MGVFSSNYTVITWPVVGFTHFIHLPVVYGDGKGTTSQKSASPNAVVASVSLSEYKVL